MDLAVLSVRALLDRHVEEISIEILYQDSSFTPPPPASPLISLIDLYPYSAVMAWYRPDPRISIDRAPSLRPDAIVEVRGNRAEIDLTHADITFTAVVLPRMDSRVERLLERRFWTLNHPDVVLEITPIDGAIDLVDNDAKFDEDAWDVRFDLVPHDSVEE